MDDNKKYEYLFLGLVIGGIIMTLYMKSVIDSDYVLRSHVAEYKSTEQIREEMPKY